MQLFVSEYKKKDTTITIADSDLLSQLRKVLRTSIGDIIWIQSPANESKKIRYEVRIEVWDKEILEGTILSEEVYEISHEKRSMIIAMPNKWDKIELIVQKLTECGLDQIIFWPSERSILKEWNPQKEIRLHKIIKEALEQSRGWILPKLIFTADVTSYLQNTELIVFDKSTPENKEQQSKKTAKDQRLKTKIGLIGPEGGLTYRDYQTFADSTYHIYGLGDTVLRTETAAIIGGRLLKNDAIS